MWREVQRRGKVSHMDLLKETALGGWGRSLRGEGNQVGAFRGPSAASRGPLGGRRATCGATDGGR